jgi:hypothetical protein
MLASVHVAAAGAAADMADVSAETVLDAAVVSVLELSFLLHAVSANTAMANVAMLDFDPFINIVPLPPLPIRESRKTPLR